MHVSKIMSHDVKLVSPDDTLEKAAKLMAKLDIGVVPVGENDRLVGMITDRDIAVRAVAAGKSPKEAKVRDFMTPDVKFVYEDEAVEDVARNMSSLQVRRLPVLNREKRLVGMISLGDVATSSSPAFSGTALRDVSQPNNPTARQRRLSGAPRRLESLRSGADGVPGALASHRARHFVRTGT